MLAGAQGKFSISRGSSERNSLVKQSSSEPNVKTSQSLQALADVEFKKSQSIKAAAIHLSVDDLQVNSL